MKKLIGLTLIGLAFVGCQSSSGRYRINGCIDGAGNGVAVLTVGGSGIQQITDTVELKEGNFTFTGKLEQPSAAVIYVCPGNERPVMLDFIAENTRMSVNGNWKDVEERFGTRRILNCRVEGSRNDLVYREFNGMYDKVMHTPEFAEYAKMQEKLNQLYADVNKEAYYRYQAETAAEADRFRKEVRCRQLQLIRKNPNVESTASCLTLLHNDIDFSELKALFDGFAPNVQNGTFAQGLKKDIAHRTRLQPGQSAPDFTVVTPDSTCITLSDLRGKYVILDFWASWCRPCRASFSEMKKLYAEYREKGLEILGITSDSRRADWLKALEEDRLPWLQGRDELTVSSGKIEGVAHSYAVAYLPTLFLIDPEGKIVGKTQDKHQLKVWLEERLRR